VSTVHVRVATDPGMSFSLTALEMIMVLKSPDKLCNLPWELVEDVKGAFCFQLLSSHIFKIKSSFLSVLFLLLVRIFLHLDA